MTSAFLWHSWINMLALLKCIVNMLNAYAVVTWTVVEYSLNSVAFYIQLGLHLIGFILYFWLLGGDYIWEFIWRLFIETRCALSVTTPKETKWSSASERKRKTLSENLTTGGWRKIVPQRRANNYKCTTLGQGIPNPMARKIRMICI